MKKILSLLLIIFLGTQICLANEEGEEDINSYFTEEPEQTTQLDGYVQYNQEPEEEAIQLDSTETAGINFTKPKSFGSKSMVSNAKKPTFHPIQDEFDTASKFSTQEYNIKPVSTTYSKKYGKFSFGTTYDSSLSSARANYSTGIFSKYEGKHFALSTVYSKRTNSNYDAFNDSFSIAPELKLTKRLSLLDIMQTDAMQLNKSNEVVLRYTPHFKKYADEVQLELGAGQSFYQDNYINSSVRFSTKFKI